MRATAEAKKGLGARTSRLLRTGGGILACLIVLLASGTGSALASSGLPTVEATLTIAGHVSGTQTVHYPGLPSDPETGCPAEAPTGYGTSADLSVHVVYRKILIPLKKLASARPGMTAASLPATPSRLLRLPVPTSSGGPGQGRFSFSGDFYEFGLEEGECVTLRHYATTASLSRSKRHKPHPIFLTSPPAFYEIGLAVDSQTIEAAPSTFEVPYGAEPQRVTESLPFFLPTDSLFFPAHGSKAVRVGWGEIGMEWNDLQGKLRQLRHRQTISIPAKGSYSRNLRVGYMGNDYGADCSEADPAPKSEAEPTTCSESTSADFTVTIHRDRIFVLH